MPAATASRSANRDLCRRWVDAFFNAQDFGVLDQFVARDLVDHSVPRGQPTDRAGSEAAFRDIFRSFPDLRMNVEADYEDGDAVVHRWRCTGTHRGPLGSFQPTNKRADVDGITIFRCKNGKIAEVWSKWDTADVLRQLGLLPANP